MPVYNGALYLRESIDSVLRQTFTNFEFIIIDDGSTDKTQEIVESYSDLRIKLVKNSKNLGIVDSLNIGLVKATGEYVIRVDADDICVRTRFEKQVKFMDGHPTVGVCGSAIRIFSRIPVIGMTIVKPVSHREIVSEMLFRNVIQHPTVILRKNLFQKYKLRYRSLYPHAEDYDLWSRAGRLFDLANLREALLYYRYHSKSIGATSNIVQQANVRQVRQEYWKSLGIKLDPDEIALLHSVCDLSVAPIDEFTAAKVGAALLSFQSQVNKKNLFPPKFISKHTSKQWYAFCAKLSTLGLVAWRLYWQSPLSKAAALSISDRLIFLMHCSLKMSDFTLQRKLARLIAGW